MTRESGEKLLDAVRAYYDETQFDYRVLWSNPKNRAMHFGYWTHAIRTHAESLNELNRVLATAIGVNPGDRVLDAGCGVGGSAFWLARHRSANVVGITPVPKQVRKAKRYLRQQRLGDRVAIELGDFAATGFEAGSFDVAWFLESLAHAADKSAVLAEARRVLRPGGRIGIAEYIREERSFDASCDRLLGDWLGGWSIPGLATAHELTGFLVDAGFRDVTSRDVTRNVRPSVRRLERIATYLWPLERVLRRIGARSDRQHRHVVAALSAFPALERRCWRYEIFTATADG